MKPKQALMFALVTQSDILRTRIPDIFSDLFIRTLLFPLPNQKQRAGEGERAAAGAGMQEEHPQPARAAPASGICRGQVPTAGCRSFGQNWGKEELSSISVYLTLAG